MKTKLYLLTILTSLLLFSCTKPAQEDFESRPVFHHFGATKGAPANISDAVIYVIDSCEYIGTVRGFQNDWLTHKGNCKFCTTRNNK